MIDWIPRKLNRGDDRNHKNTTHLGVSRIGIEYITEEFTGDSNAGNDQPVDVVRVDNKGPARSVGSEARHAVKINEKG